MGDMNAPAAPVDPATLLVEHLELGVRAANCLHAAGIRTVSELLEYSAADLLRLREFGKKALADIKDVLAGRGLSLAAPEQIGTRRFMLRVANELENTAQPPDGPTDTQDALVSVRRSCFEVARAIRRVIERSAP